MTESAGGPDAPATGERVAIVVRVDSKSCRLRIDGDLLSVPLRGRLFKEHGRFASPVAVGDRVRVVPAARGEPAITEVLPRRNVFSRPDPSTRREQAIAANVDAVVVVAACQEPPFNARVIDRILVAVERAGSEGIIVLNKCDLLAAGEAPPAELDVYAGLGYPVLRTCALSGQGVPELAAHLRGRTSLVVGASGVGKSALLMAIDPSLAIRTQPVSGWSGKGQHTTTAAEMRSLPGGGDIVDTPGVREFGIAGLLREDVSVFFRDMAPFVDGCRMRRCLHTEEPGCTVRDAFEAGRIAPFRYDSYLRIIESMEPQRRR